MPGYTPKSENQLAQESLLPAGEYDFEIIETLDRPSKAGNYMYTFKLHVFDADSQPRIIFDYIALGNNFGERKLRHAADASGIINIYESGKMTPSDFQGRTGRLKLKQQPGNSQYPDPKNVVEDYIKREVAGVTYDAPKKQDDELDDSIPF